MRLESEHRSRRTQEGPRQGGHIDAGGTRLYSRRILRLRRTSLLSLLHWSLFCLGAGGGPGRVLAADVSVLVAAQDAGSVSTATRACAEIDAAEFACASIEPTLVSAETDALVQRLEQRELQALVLLAQGSDESGITQITVVVIDPVSAGDHFRRMDRRVQGNVQSVGLKANELLRALWLEAGLSQPEPVEPAARPALEAESPSPLNLTLGVGASISPGGVPPAPKLAMGIELLPRPWLGGVLLAGLTPLPAIVDEDAGLTLQHATLSAGPLFRVQPRERVVLGASLSVGAAFLWARAQNAPASTRWSPLLAVRMFVGRRIGNRLTLRVGVDVQTLSAAVPISLDSERFARFGMPMVDGMLGLELALR